MTSPTSASPSITVVREDDHEREIWRWRVRGFELQATGICLTEASAWKAARAAMDVERPA